jgi:MFS family permease
MKLFSIDFKLMIIGQIISLFGANILKFALALYVLDLTGRADVFATILAVSTIPIIILSPIGGAIADRFNRRNLMVIFDFSSCSIILIFTLWLQGGSATVFIIGVVMTLLSVISTMYQPTVQASIPLLVPKYDLMKANGVVSGISALTGIVAPILGGVLYSLIGLKAIVIVSCISFFLSAVMELFIKMPFTKREQIGSMTSTIIYDIKDGVCYITKGNPFILKIMLLAAGLNLFLVPLFLVGVPYIVKITMGGSDVVFGIAQGAISFSSILGAIAIGVIGQKMKIAKIYLLIALAGIFLIPLAIAVYPLTLNLGFWFSFLLFILCAVLIVLTTTIISIFLITIIQKQTPNELLGKVMAILFATSTCATPIGQILYGALLDGFSTSIYIPILIVSGVTSILAFVAKVMFGHKTCSNE